MAPRFGRPGLWLLLALAGTGLAAGVLAYLGRGGPPLAQALADPAALSMPLVEAVPGQPHRLRLSADAARRLGIATAAVRPASATGALRLPGALLLDPDALVRLRARFAGEVVALGQYEGAEEGTPASVAHRPLRPGDPVKRNQLMAT